MAKKIRELFTRVLQFKSASLSAKSKKIVNTFTDMIEDIDKANIKADAEITVALEAIEKLEALKAEFERTKEQNENIKRKIENIIS